MKTEALESDRHRVVRHVFINTADDNYITARWCYFRGLLVDFHWLAVHCLEKYLKAVLLLNGKSSKRYRHDVEKLFSDTTTLAGGLLPTNVQPPPDLDMGRWQTESALGFLVRLYANGEAHNRYALFGYQQRREDLFKVDRMVFSVRRLCCPLDAPAYPRHPERGTHRDLLTKQPEWWALSPSARLESLVATKGDPALRRVLFELNTLFAPEGFEHGAHRSTMRMSNSVLWREIVKPKQLQLRDWVIANFDLPKDVEAQLRSISTPPAAFEAGGRRR